MTLFGLKIFPFWTKYVEDKKPDEGEVKLI